MPTVTRGEVGEIFAPIPAGTLNGIGIGEMIAARRREPMVASWKMKEEETRLNEIARTSCSETSISSLLERFGYELTLETLDLDDQTFSFFYPDLYLGSLVRKELKEAVIQHVNACTHCRLIAENHRWADAELDIAIAAEKATQSSKRAKAAAAGA